MSESICYLNGEFQPLANAAVPVLDRGFIFGDGIYEMIPVFSGHAFRLTEHLQRLGNSLKAVYINNPNTVSEWTGLIDAMIKKNGGGHQAVYLQITRGVADRDHAFPQQSEPTVFIMSNPLPESQKAHPVNAIVLQDPRWDSCDIKAISLLPNVLLRQQAREKGAYEAILIRDGYLTEGAASNVFVIKDGIVKTPPKGPKLLPGITRDLVVELLQKEARPCEETEVSEAELRDADEIWLSSSTKEILPVTQLDGKAVGTGEPGPVWHSTVDLYQSFKDSFTGTDAAA
ncbi:MAG: D-amino acid aminotransferase [Gammaproteobacteria bacterium]